MREFSPADAGYMATAIRLGWRGRFGAHPNPRVGCVLVRDGVVVGRGWHERAGGPHAEIQALSAAGKSAAGATAYVSLEPCSHHGKTPPCTDALIRAGVGRIVAAMRDPFPSVAGRGFEQLRQAGIDVATGLLEAEARRLNEGYLSRMERGRPFVRLKTAVSLDGATAMTSGESKWITGREARLDVQRLRAVSGAVLTGVGTVIDDDPRLSVRDVDIPRPPLRAILDVSLRTPVTSRLLAEPGTTLVYCSDDTAREALETAGATVAVVPAARGGLSLDAVLGDLAARQVNDVLVECGATLAGQLVAADLVDELVIYQAPHIMGSESRRMFSTPGRLGLDDRLSFRIAEVRRVGEDLRISARPVRD